MKSVTRCLLLTAITFVGSQFAPAQTLDDLAASTVYLHIDEPQFEWKAGIRYEIGLKDPATGKSISRLVTTNSGTGFLVCDKSRTFLITAKHVAVAINPQWSATVRSGGTQSLTFALSDLVGETLGVWTFHEEADVAALELHQKRNLPPLSDRCVTAELLPKQLEAPGRGQSVTVIGFPLGLGASNRFSPISHEMKPASGLVTIPGIGGRPEAVFLVDSPSVQGFSGAPLFKWPLLAFTGTTISGGGQTQLLGMNTPGQHRREVWNSSTGRLHPRNHRKSSEAALRGRVATLNCVHGKNLGGIMYEMAIILMRSEPGWIEVPTRGATSVFQFADSTMTIFPDGSWRCIAPDTHLARGVATGKVGQLEKFLQVWGAANPL